MGTKRNLDEMPEWDDTSYDFYEIEQNWDVVMKLVEQIDKDMPLFLKKKSARASVRMRNNLLKVRKITSRIRKDILNQRYDNQANEYLDS